ncbi:MAG: DUF531 domain-containing protein [Thermoplasmata archaeon HGW-Thermoplasmata-1]|nr:MAG: DUF531 domain-containing protein [Thermoplasmata archaeon HGW-Thermoplasmata-1]
MKNENIGRLTLGLYNSYDPSRFHEAHRRALARAAPICKAFDLNLVTFGFPYDEGRRREVKNPDAPDLRTPKDIAEFVADSTTIGGGGEYLLELADEGRFSVFDFPARGGGFPPQLGEPIITTSKPDEKKAAAPSDVAEMLLRRKSACLVVGLGPHGLPKEIIKNAKCHLDLTGRGISMETATAMAALPAVIVTLARERASVRSGQRAAAGGW